MGSFAAGAVVLVRCLIASEIGLLEPSAHARIVDAVILILRPNG